MKDTFVIIQELDVARVTHGSEHGVEPWSMAGDTGSDRPTEHTRECPEYQ